MPFAPPPKNGSNSLLDDDDDGWQDMPVVRTEEFVSDFDAVDREKYGYAQPKAKGGQAQSNATGNLIDFDERGNEWRAKTDTLEESEYTRLKLDEDEDGDDEHGVKGGVVPARRLTGGAVGQPCHHPRDGVGAAAQRGHDLQQGQGCILAPV